MSDKEQDQAKEAPKNSMETDLTKYKVHLSLSALQNFYSRESVILD
jgi:hypothetical protein